MVGYGEGEDKKEHSPSLYSAGLEMEAGRERITATGIASLDKILNGGFPRGSLILLAGNPGTGKTTLGAKILYEGMVKFNEPAMYVSFVEPRHDFMSHMATLGMDFVELEKKGLFHFVEALTIIDEDALLVQLEDVLKSIAQQGIKRLVLDSVTAMLQIIRDKAKVREIMQNFFVNGVKPLGTIALLIAEHPYGARMVGYGIEEFIVDAVILLRFEIEGGKLKRIMELRKARWAPIRQAEIPFYIRPGIVFELSLPEELSEVPPLDMTRFYDAGMLVKSLVDAGILRPVSSGGGGERRAGQAFVLPYGAQVVLGIAIPINTRVFIGLMASGLLSLYPSDTVGVVTFKSSPPSIRNITVCTLKALGKSVVENEVDGRLRVLSLNPTVFTLNELYDMIRVFLDRNKPSIVFFEGMELLDFFFERRELLAAMYNLMLRNKRNKVTSIYLYSMPERKGTMSVPFAEIADIGGFLSSIPEAGVGSADRQRLVLELYGNLGHASFEAVLDIGKLMSMQCVG